VDFLEDPHSVVFDVRLAAAMLAPKSVDYEKEKARL
jgi:hypothetical protein